MKRLHVIIIFLVMVTTLSFTNKKVAIFLAGDSTMSIKDSIEHPETGWGMPFATFFNDHIKVENYAINGESTLSFRVEGEWDKLLNKVTEGDYVFIQFGHNDENNDNKERYASPAAYRNNLAVFVKEVRIKNAHPVLLTSVARRNFDTKGKLINTHGVYPDIVRSVAKELKVPLIDMNKKSSQLLQEYGMESSKKIFNYLQPGESPNYPQGNIDNTHFSPFGAKAMAGLVVEGMKENSLKRLIKNLNKQ